MSEEQSKQRFVSIARLAAVVRIVLFLAILFAGWSVTRTFARIIADWRGPGRLAPSTQSATADLPPLPGLLPLAGQWSFAELDWSVQSQVIGAEEVEASFRADATPGDAIPDDDLPDADDELMQLIDKLSITPTTRGCYTIYQLDRADLKGQLVLRSVAGRAKTVALAVALPKGGAQWQLLKIVPRAGAETLDRKQPHLLPLPVGAKRTGGRFADDGRLLLELVALDSNADALVNSWTAAGWTVRSSGIGGPEVFSSLCVRGDEVVYAWSTNPRDSLKNLMLVRTPAGADTKR